MHTLILKPASYITALAVTTHGDRLAYSALNKSTINIVSTAGDINETSVTGHTGEIQSLCFSHDGHYLAAVNSRGDIWIWNTVISELVQHKSGDGLRKRRQLTYLATKSATDLPKLTSYPWRMHAPAKTPAPDGKRFFQHKLGIEVLRGTKLLTRLEIRNYELSSANVVRLSSWSQDSSLIGFSGDTWLGIWDLAADSFVGDAFDQASNITALATATQPSVLYYACEGAIYRYEPTPLPLKTNWQERVLNSETSVKIPPITELIWDLNDYGYSGVRLQSNQSLLWFDHRHNTLDGNSLAHEQTVEDFLKNGTVIQVPTEIMTKLLALLADKSTN